MACMEPVEQEGTPSQQCQKLDSVRPSRIQEDSTHVSISQGQEERMIEILLLQN